MATRSSADKNGQHDREEERDPLRGAEAFHLRVRREARSVESEEALGQKLGKCDASPMCVFEVVGTRPKLFHPFLLVLPGEYRRLVRFGTGRVDDICTDLDAMQLI